MRNLTARRLGRPSTLLVAAALFSAGCGSLVPSSGPGAGGSDGLGSVPNIGTTGSPGSGRGPTGSARPGAGPSGAGSRGSQGSPGTGTAGGRPSPGSTGPSAPTAGPVGVLAPLKVGYAMFNQAGFAAYTGNTSLGGDPAGNMTADRREMDALVKYANATGGVGGRKIAPPIPVEISTADTTSESTMTARCTEATEDDKVNVFIDMIFTLPNEAFVTCFARHKVTLVSTLLTSSTRFVEQLRPFAVTTRASIDRMAAAFATGLNDVGWYRGATVGVVIDDLPETVRVYNEQIAPRFQAYGVHPTDVYRVDATDAGLMSSQAASAGLALRTHGVDHVFFLANIISQLAFTNYADSQAWYPRYGWSDYADDVSDGGYFVTPTQNKNAVAVSAEVDYVVDKGRDQGTRALGDSIDRNDPHLRASERRCLDILTKYTGLNYYDDSSGRSTEWDVYCDHFLVWLAAARTQGSTYTAPMLGEGLRSLGGAFLPIISHSDDFSSGRLDGSSSYRAGIFSSNADCKCFVAATNWKRF